MSSKEIIDHNNLAKQLNSFSISSEEERLTHQLNQTHIAAPSNSIFSLPPHLQQQAQHQPTVNNNSTHNWNNNNSPPQFTNPNPDTTHPWEESPQWDTSNNKNATERDDGWGEGLPSYTSISQGTYFGFNSIMEAPKIVSISAQNTTASAPSSSAISQAFGRFKHAPVTFTSAATAYSHNSK